ncbi:hypothetical protein ACP4OV_012571 [Aristida adscensionis]
MIRTLKECNIPTRTMIVIMSFLRGGLSAMPYSGKDISNYRTAINTESMANDMTQVLRYFLR